MRVEGLYDRVVVDTNVLISAALSGDSVLAQCVDQVLTQARLVFSTATFVELNTRIWKPKFDRYLTLERRQQLLHDLSAAAVWVEPGPDVQQRHWSRDPTDDAFIQAALAARARCLVTGDQDLLVLETVDQLRILTPRAVLAEWAKTGAG